MIVALMGNDGSGKTTAAKMFAEKLRSIGLSVHCRKEFDYFLLSHIFRILDKRKIDEYRRLLLTKGGGNRKPRYFKVWPYLVWLDLFLDWLWTKLFMRDSVVIMDRYAYDFLMSWEWLGYANACLRWLYIHFPKPDLTFILDVSPLTAFLRKKDSHSYSLHFYEIQRRRYLRLAKTLETIVIDTEKTVEQCLGEVIMEFRKYFISKLSNEDKVLLFYSFPRFRLSMLEEFDLNFDWSILNWNYIVDMAVNCNTENVLCRNLLRYQGNQLPIGVVELIRYVLQKSNERVGLLLRTLRAVSSKLGQEEVPFVIVKTIASFDYGATDIDVLVRKADFEKASKALSSIFKTSKSFWKHRAVTHRCDALLPVDLHHEISWLGIKVVDEETIWRRKRDLILNGLTVSVPAIEDEILILALHSVFQHHYTTLGEGYFVSSLLKEMSNSESIKILENQYVSFIVAYCALKERLLYGEESFQVSRKVKFAPTNLLDIVFFHSPGLAPKRNLLQSADYFLTIYRKLRFRISGKLPYNESWIRRIDTISIKNLSQAEIEE